MSHPTVVFVAWSHLAASPPCTHAGDVREFEEELAALLAGLDPAAVALCDVTDLVGGVRAGGAVGGGRADVAGGAGRGSGHVETGGASQRRRSSWPGSRGRRCRRPGTQLKTSKRVRKLPATDEGVAGGEVVGREGRSDRGRGRRSRPKPKPSCWRSAETRPLAKVQRRLSARARPSIGTRRTSGSSGIGTAGVHRRRRCLELPRPRDRSKAARRVPGGAPAARRRACSRPRRPKAAASRSRRTRSTRSSSSPAAPPRLPRPTDAEPAKKPKRPPAKFSAIIRVDLEALTPRARRRRRGLRDRRARADPGLGRTRSCSATRS